MLAMHSCDPELRLRFSTRRKIINIYLAEVSLENTEIGCHIKIDSSPSIYKTDAQAMIQFFEV